MVMVVSCLPKKPVSTINFMHCNIVFRSFLTSGASNWEGERERKEGTIGIIMFLHAQFYSIHFFTFSKRVGFLSGIFFSSTLVSLCHAREEGNMITPHTETRTGLPPGTWHTHTQRLELDSLLVHGTHTQRLELDSLLVHGTHTETRTGLPPGTWHTHTQRLELDSLLVHGTHTETRTGLPLLVEWTWAHLASL